LATRPLPPGPLPQTGGLFAGTQELSAFPGAVVGPSAPRCRGLRLRCQLALGAAPCGTEAALSTHRNLPAAAHVGPLRQVGGIPICRNPESLLAAPVGRPFFVTHFFRPCMLSGPGVLRLETLRRAARMPREAHLAPAAAVRCSPANLPRMVALNNRSDIGSVPRLSRRPLRGRTWRRSPGSDAEEPRRVAVCGRRRNNPHANAPP
jgi:hypothetical protein